MTMSEHYFWGYFTSHEHLKNIAVRGNYDFAHHVAASTRMAYEVFYRLESFGPMRVMTADRNGEDGYVFALGHDDATLESIPGELKLWMEKSYRYPPELWTYDDETGLFTTPCVGEDDDVLWRGGEVKTNLGEWRKKPLRCFYSIFIRPCVFVVAEIVVLKSGHPSART
ncbi:hypothetical protein FRC10_001887 [Ceratobasidium sp. 414]|nr:hypothetical protein FRC10_001887 [Ceratobasidium sp. 414]